MTATPSIELPAWMAEQLSQASPGAADEELHPLEHVRNWFTDGAPQLRRGQ